MKYNGLRIDPCIPSDWEECGVDRYFCNAVKGTLQITVDGERISGNVVPVFEDRRTHLVDVIMNKGGRTDEEIIKSESYFYLSPIINVILTSYRSNLRNKFVDE